MNFIIKFFQCIFCWRIKTSSEDEIRTADVVLGQSFALRKNNQPGESNQQLANIARQIFNRYGVPLVLQWEIAECLPYLPKAFVVREHRIQGQYLDTYEVIGQMWKFCQQQGRKKAIMLAHPDHYWRCWMVAKRFGFNLVAVDVSTVSYDSKSVQVWTTSVKRFIPYDFAARILYLLTGKI